MSPRRGPGGSSPPLHSAGGGGSPGDSSPPLHTGLLICSPAHCPGDPRARPSRSPGGSSPPVHTARGPQARRTPAPRHSLTSPLTALQDSLHGPPRAPDPFPAGRGELRAGRPGDLGPKAPRSCSPPAPSQPSPVSGDEAEGPRTLVSRFLQVCPKPQAFLFLAHLEPGGPLCADPRTRPSGPATKMPLVKRKRWLILHPTLSGLEFVFPTWCLSLCPRRGSGLLMIHSNTIKQALCKWDLTGGLQAGP